VAFKDGHVLKVLQSAQLDKVTFVFNFFDELRRLPASK
jgi:hypothetical protein